MIKYKENQRLIKFLSVIFIIFILLNILSLRPPKYYLNLSSSMPKGIYKLIDCNELQKGDFVIFDVPKQAQPYIYGRKWLPEKWVLIKTVGALEGDQIEITDDSILINNEYIGPIFSHDHEGKPLPKIRGKFKIPERQWFPIATYIPNSFDGRYFGPISLDLIRGKAIPFLIFERDNK